MQVEKDVIYDSAYNLAADLYVPDEANGVCTRRWLVSRR